MGLTGPSVLWQVRRRVVPPDHRALGIPARLREGAGIAAQVDYAVPLYVENARLYRERLTRIG